MREPCPVPAPAGEDDARDREIASLRERLAALERENARLRERVAELERGAALDSTTSSRPPAGDGLKKRNGTPRRTRSRRQPSPRASGGQPGHRGTTLAQTANTDHGMDHDPAACSNCGVPLSDADRHAPPSVGRSSTCPGRSLSRSPNIAAIAAAAPPWRQPRSPTV